MIFTIKSHKHALNVKYADKDIEKLYSFENKIVILTKNIFFHLKLEQRWDSAKKKFFF